MKKPVRKVLFQGDSLVDCGRDRKEAGPNAGLGCGFVYLIAAHLCADFPEAEVYNRGIGGNRIVDMYARWTEDTLLLDFDLLSINNGINDVGFALRMQRGADCRKYERIYDDMLAEVRACKPDAALLLMQPSILRRNLAGQVSRNDIYEDWDIWYENICERGEAVRRLAEKYDAIYLPVREILEEASHRLPLERLTPDGIHLAPAGNEIVARAWLEATRKLF